MISLLFGSVNAAFGQSPSFNGGTTDEMPAAVKNMQGTPGYETEVKKWEASQSVTQESQQREAQSKVAALQGAAYSAPSMPAKSVTSSLNTPYHLYNGISDPEKAKEAWLKDQAAKKED
ncbi:MAG: hypothetical protein RLZZ519_2199 [Bacteroidota bacterium]|jgi:hypothetical protein